MRTIKLILEIMKYVYLIVFSFLMVSCIDEESNNKKPTNTSIVVRLASYGVERDQDDWWCSGRHFYLEFELENRSDHPIKVHSTFLYNFCTENENRPNIRLFLEEGMLEKYALSDKTLNLGYVPLDITNLFNDSILLEGAIIKVRISDNTWSSAGDSLIQDRLEFLRKNSSKIIFKNLFQDQTDDIEFRFTQE